MFWSFSPTNLGQIWKSMTVLESTRPEDSKTHPDCWIWWRIGWDIEGLPQPLFQLLLLVLGLENLDMTWLVVNPQYLSQFSIKFNNQGVSQNPQDVQIPKLSLVFIFDQDLWEKKTKTFRDKWNFHYCIWSSTEPWCSRASIENHINRIFGKGKMF